jgi:Tol biopolymer transport system component
MRRQPGITIARLAISFAVCAAAWGLVLVLTTTASGGTRAIDSLRLTFARSADRGGGLYVIGFDGRGMKRLTSGLDEAPAWSPDGRRVAFSRTPDRGHSYEIDVMTAKGARPRALTHGGYAQFPSWAADGSRIVFSASGGRFGRSTDPSCAPNLWTMRPDGSGLSRLVRAGVEPAYSPDGRRIAFVRPDARDRPWMYIVGSSGRGVRRVGVGDHPSWSPDGRYVVVQRGVGLNQFADLWLLRVSDGRATRLTHTPTVSEQGPAWSLDGHWIAFSMVRRGVQDIYAIPAFGGSLRAITHGPRAGGNFEPAWQPRP